MLEGFDNDPILASGNSTRNIPGTFLYTTNSGTSTFYFASNTDLMPAGTNQLKIINATSLSQSLKIEFMSNNSPQATFNLVDHKAILVKGFGRFMAEFLIISKEN